MSKKATIKKVAFGIAGFFGVAALVVVILALTKPDKLHVQRSLAMRGTPELVFPYANDFRKFTTWIPWVELDPNQTVEYSDPSSGVGAWYTWSGNDDVGTGRMELLSAEPTKVVHKLEFIEPFASVAEATVSVRPLGDGKIEVTWAYDQDAGFGTKLMTVFMDMDAMLGADFDKGLARLKPLVEADADAAADAG
jgi:hypothetical protein